jgi:hypothetical protein
MAAKVATIYRSLPARDRARAVVFAGNYGEAAALQFFEPGVPVISGHNQYWLWGTKGYDGSVVVQVNGTCFASDHLFASRTVLTRIENRYAVSYENDIPINLCRGIRMPLARAWPLAKDYE